MRALVIGGTRYFGKRLVQLLLERGVDVTLLSRGQTSDEFGERVHRIRMDRKELRADHPLLRGLAWDIVYDQVCYDAMEAKGACEAFRGKTARYVFTSSQSVYGPGREIDESVFDPAQHVFSEPVDRNKDYSEAKRQAETMFFRERAFPVAAVRFPIVLGEDDYTGRLRFHVEHVAREKAFHLPDPNARISFVHAADAARFLAFLLDHPWEGAINCCSPDSVLLSELIAMIERDTGKKARLVPSGEGIDESPFGAEADWYMSVSPLIRMGFSPTPCSQWLPDLIRAEIKKLH